MKANKHTEVPIQKNIEEVMDLTYIRNLVTLISESNIDEIEIEEAGKKIRIAKGKNNTVASAIVPQQVSILQPPSVSEIKPLAAHTPSTTKEIRSPIVGTFYHSPAPDADAYVEVGAHIKVGTVLCIIEAMKLMNEIESDIEGKILKILVENGKPVEFNQPLFLVEPV